MLLPRPLDTEGVNVDKPFLLTFISNKIAGVVFHAVLRVKLEVEVRTRYLR